MGLSGRSRRALTAGVILTTCGPERLRTMLLVGVQWGCQLRLHGFHSALASEVKGFFIRMSELCVFTEYESFF